MKEDGIFPSSKIFTQCPPVALKILVFRFTVINLF